MMDYSLYSTTPAIPEASSMIETFRAIGYNVETAIADIIDNSISAGAKNIWIDFEWLGSKTWLSIKDDGNGMSDNELIQAMKPGSKNPLDNRDIRDLGRFGLGLKTASFSQARKLSVVSKKDLQPPVFWTWDLDFVNQTSRWELLKYLPNDKFLQEINSLKSGTIVIWNDIDRVVKDLQKDDDKQLDKFLRIMEQVKNHLAMVFHRFIENKRIGIYFQGRVIKSWNPFLENEPSTQSFPKEYIQGGLVTIRGFVLPHKSKLSEEKYKIAEGQRGWNAQQGFYIYRNDRLILAGEWLGLFRKEEHYKLARIQIDLPNSLDSDWQVDIKKSIARPPIIFKDAIRAYATKVRAQAVEVYRHKGKIVQMKKGQEFVPFWVDSKRANKWFYKINREHPLLKQIILDANSHPERAIEMLCRFIEETIPAKSIYIKESELSDSQGKPFESTNHDNIKDAIYQLYYTLINQGKSENEVKEMLLNLEPFNFYPEYINAI